jgi:hypothetical protein
MTDTNELPWTRDENTHTGVYYVHHRDGRVAAFGRDRDSTRSNAWRATAWSADPRTHDDATYDALADDASYSELQAALNAWAGPCPEGTNS